MKSSHAWRQEYYYRRGRTILPRSLLDDVLADMQEVEAENATLRARIEHEQDLNSDLQQEIYELQEDLLRLERQAPHGDTPPR